MDTCDYPYVGRWLGPRGCATVVLITPEWIITSEHVARKKIEDSSNVDVTVRFFNPNGDVSAKVANAFGYQETKCPGMGIALGKLDHYIECIPSIAMAQNGVSKGKNIEITIVGNNANNAIRGAYCKLNNKGHLVRVYDCGNSQRGVPGDSGGAWIVESPDGGLVLVGIIKGTDEHNRGVASQPIVFRKWIDQKLAAFDAKCRWVEVSHR